MSTAAATSQAMLGPLINKEYLYTPLSQLQDSPPGIEAEDVFKIRILELLPGQHDSPLDGKLKTVEFEHHGPYEALSYTWGTEDVSSCISVDDRKLPIRPNLDAALRALRKEHSTRYLWVDAVCINQGDISERNKQVSRMREIFEQADQTVVWLGPATKDSDFVMDNAFEDFGIPEPSTAVEARPVDHDTILRIASIFCHRRYFTRIWVLQELAVSKRILTVCGDRALPWSLLKRKIDWLMETGFRFGFFEISPDFDSVVLAPSFLCHTLDDLAYHKDKETLPLRVLISASGLNATDPRDKIFALLGILSNSTANLEGSTLSRLRVDYSKTAEQVMVEAAKCLITDYGLEVLALAHASARELRIPSWAPDWSASFQAERWIMPLQCRIYNVWAHATPDSMFFDSTNFTASNAATILSISFSEVDSIIEAFSRISSDDTGRSLLKSLKDLEERAVASNFQWRPATDGESKKGAFRRTVLADAWQDSNWQFIRLADQPFGRLCAWLDGDYDLEEGDSLLLWYRSMQYSRFFISGNGRFGLADAEIRPGDRIGLVEGSSMPVVIRHIQNDQHEWVGMCYLHGIMDGRNDWNAETYSRLRAETIQLI